jgi:hypothetical protein
MNAETFDRIAAVSKAADGLVRQLEAFGNFADDWFSGKMPEDWVGRMVCANQAILDYNRESYRVGDSQERLTLWAQKMPDGSVALRERPEAGGRVVSTHPAHYTNKPTRRNRWVMHNCFRYRLAWID